VCVCVCVCVESRQWLPQVITKNHHNMQTGQAAYLWAI